MNAVIDRPPKVAKPKAAPKTREKDTPEPQELDIQAQCNLIQEGIYRIECAAHTVGLGLGESDESELRAVHILIEDMVHRFVGMADLFPAPVHDVHESAREFSCALSIVIPTIKRLNENSLESSVLYTATYLLEDARRMVDHAFDNWSVGSQMQELQAEHKPAGGAGR